LKREIFWLNIPNWVRFVAAKRYWKASFPKIYLIEIVVFMVLERFIAARIIAASRVNSAQSQFVYNPVKLSSSA
jgi:hypothetical protein